MHVSAETKEAVRLGMGLVATTVALVLGLLISSAKSFYDNRNAEVAQLAADTVLIDRILVHYGPETQDSRAVLHSSMAEMLNRSSSNSSMGRLDANTHAQEALYDKLQALTPGSESQKLLRTEALGLALEIGHTRWLMFEQRNTPLPTPLLMMLIFWLTTLFVSFGLFVRPNATVVISLGISALALTGAIFLIAEMYQPYKGLIRVSDAPVRAALAQMEL